LVSVTPDIGARRGWYHGWNIVAACALAEAMANGLPVNAFTLFLQDWSAELHAPISSLQLGLAALGIFSSVLAPFVGVLVDRKPARLLMGGGLLTLALFEIGISFVTTMWQFLALYILLLPTAVVFSTTLPANAIVSRWFVRRLGLALGLTAFGLGLAGVVLPQLIAALLPLGWRMIWRMMGVLVGLVVTPIVVWALRDHPANRDGLHYLTPEHSTRPPVSHPVVGGNGGLGWRDVLARRNFWLMVIVYLPMLALYGGCAHNLAPIGVGLGLSRQAAAALVSIFSLSHVSSTLVVGFLSDRFGSRLPLAALATATALGGIIVATSSNATSLTIGTAFVGLSGGMWPLLGAASAC
jgi:MFS family permease